MFSCEFSCSVSSYPTVGSTLHQWLFFINDRVTTLCPNPATLLGPRGGFHWAAKEKQGRERCFHEATIILINQWPEMSWTGKNNLLTQSSRNQVRDRSTCRNLSGKNLLLCSSCLWRSRCLRKKWEPRCQIYLIWLYISKLLSLGEQVWNCWVKMHFFPQDIITLQRL